METLFEIVLARHGETEWSRSGRHTSFTEVPLSPRGREQARALAPRLAGRPLVTILSSPRQRALDTCELAGLRAEAQLVDDLTEWDYGDYEGRTTEEIRREVPGWTIFTHGAPGGESPAAVGARADRVLAMVAVTPGPIAVFSHGHFLRVLAARWVSLPASAGCLFGLETGSLSALGYEREQRVVGCWNA